MSIPIFSLEGLAAWLEQQPGETEYNYGLSSDCLIARYCRDRGAEYDPVAVDRETFINNGRCDDLHEQLEWIAVVPPRTYAAALDRCRARMAEAVQ